MDPLKKSWCFSAPLRTARVWRFVMFMYVGPHWVTAWNVYNHSHPLLRGLTDVVLYCEAWVEFAAETFLTQERQKSRWGGGKHCIVCKDEDEQAVNLLVLLHNGAMCDVSEKIDTSHGSLVLSCGEFLHHPGCFKDIFAAVMDCSCELSSWSAKKISLGESIHKTGYNHPFPAWVGPKLSRRQTSFDVKIISHFIIYNNKHFSTQTQLWFRELCRIEVYHVESQRIRLNKAAEGTLSTSFLVLDAQTRDRHRTSGQRRGWVRRCISGWTSCHWSDETNKIRV